MDELLARIELGPALDIALGHLAEPVPVRGALGRRRGALL
jgi:hypothetical protein